MGELGSVFSTVAGLFHDHVNTEKLKQAIAEQIYSEIRFNGEILNEISGLYEQHDEQNYPKIDQLVAILSDKSYQTLKEHFVPLKEVFPGQIDRGSRTFRFRHGSEHDKDEYHAFRNWSKGITSEYQLIERIYMRLNILKALHSAGVYKKAKSFCYVYWLTEMASIYHVDLESAKYSA